MGAGAIDPTAGVADEAPTAPAPRKRLRSGQIAGLPPTYVMPLVPASLAGPGARALFQPCGLLVGHLVEGHVTMGMAPVPVPDFQFTSCVARVEFTSIDDLPEAPAASVSIYYLDRAGRTHRLFTPPLYACGDLAEFEIPADRLARRRVLSTSIRFDLTSFDGGEPMKPRPILFRGAWLEFME